MEQNDFNNFGRGSPKEYFCEIILISCHWSRRRCHLKVYLVFSDDGHFVQCGGMILAIFIEGHPRIISSKLF